MNAEIKIHGHVVKTFYSTPSFSAGVIKTDDRGHVRFAGPLLAVEHDVLTLKGHMVESPYGPQLKVSQVEYDTELDPAGLAHFLAKNPQIVGIGPVKAGLIAKKFGHDFDNMITDSPEAIAKAAKLSHVAINTLRDAWLRNKTYNAVSTQLAAANLNHNQISKLIEKYGNNVLNVLKRDPYILINEICGFGFRRVDEIARKMGVVKTFPGRIRAGLHYVVEEALTRGHCWVELDDLMRDANTLLTMDELDSLDRIDAEFDALIKEKMLFGMEREGYILIGKPSIVKMEQGLADIFKQVRSNPHFPVGNHESLVDMNVPELNEKQREAVLNALTHSISLISGGAGSGKTYTISAIHQICTQCGLNVVLAAPTGKAAKRMEEVTDEPAFTVHRLLGYKGGSYYANTTIDADVVVIDEVSMVDIPLAWHFFKAIDLGSTAVVLVGDHNQLPPVGPGNLLRDLINTGAIPTVILDRVIRQAGVLKENSAAILRGELREPHKNAWYVLNQHTAPQDAQHLILDMYGRALTEKLGFDLINDVQLLTPMRKGLLGTETLNIKLQRLIQKKLYDVDIPELPPNYRPKLYRHDKVIQTRNNYDLGVMNGTIGRVIDVGEGGKIIVEFDGKPVKIKRGSNAYNDLQLAYALTIHKSQGSEFPCAIVVAHKLHTIMLHRNLIYTGVTRAKKTAIIVGDTWGIRYGIRTQKLQERHTFLSLFLEQKNRAATAA